MGVPVPEPALQGEKRWVWEQYADFIEWRKTKELLGELESLPDEEEHWRGWLESAAFHSMERAVALLAYSLDSEWTTTANNEACDLIMRWLVESFHLPFLGTGQEGPDDAYEYGFWLNDLRDANAEIGYESYLQSADWAAARDSAHRRAGGRCQACNTTKHLHVHHRTYERRGEERADDLIVLCARCHQAVHFHGGAHKPSRRTATA